MITAMSWSNLATVLATLVTLFGAGVAIVNYRRAVLTRRAEWLSSLHERFFETERYAQVRRILDYHDEPAYSELHHAVAAHEHSPVVDEFFRYLNFFELLARLHELGQISNDEIIALFEYDLRLIASHPFILETLNTQGFEHLPQLLKKIKLTVR